MKWDNEADFKSIQDKAYDLLGDMLIERDAAVQQEELEKEMQEGDTAEMDAFFMRYEQANLRAIEKYYGKQRIVNFFLCTIPRISKVAVVFIAIMSIAGGIAVAASQTVRTQVMQLLLRIEEEYTQISLTHCDEASFDVPGDWMGSSYPSYIPAGMQLTSVIDGYDQFMAEYRNDGKDRKVAFYESNAESEINLDTEGAKMIETRLFGNTLAYVVEKGDAVSIFWSDGQELFLITAHGLGRDEIMMMAESVKRIK